MNMIERDSYRNIYKGKMILENETGLFLCNENGKLLSYYPSVDVLIDRTEIRGHYTYRDVFYKPCIYSMTVPAGVTGFSSEFFRGGMIERELVLPNTLKMIGSDTDVCVFADTSIGRVILPSSIESFGNFAFGNSKIEEIVYPDRIIGQQYARQFKGTKINKLLLPQNIFDYLRMQGHCPELLFNPHDVEITNYIVY